MSYLTMAEAIKRQPQKLIQGVANAAITVDEFMPALPIEFETDLFVDFNYNSSTTAGLITAAGGGGEYTVDASGSTLKRLYLERFKKSKGIPNDLSAKDLPYQLNRAGTELGEALANELVNGTDERDVGAGTASIASLASYTGTSGDQVIDAGGDALTFAMLHEAADLVKTGNNKVFVMNAIARRKVYALMEAVGGVPQAEVRGLPHGVISFYGIPILRNDFIHNEDVGYGDDDTSIYCLDLNADLVNLLLRADDDGAETTSWMNLVKESGGTHDRSVWTVSANANLMIRSPQAVSRIYRADA